ncbi:MAG: thiamine pyrophosphate-binding protein, partial [Burkholderiales bacterium]|nr:thiamine pyrophosphate-binding protein [Burkholderiales bacterium]
MTATLTGREAFVRILADEGVTHLFGNPGTTELAIMQALGAHPEIRFVLGLQESVVLAMADGYARASGRLAAANVHVAPGLGNAMGALYNARFSGSPLVLTAGQQEQGHGLREPLLYAPLVEVARPFVKWAVEVTRAQDLPLVLRRAAKVATTPPTGPVFVSLPADVLDDTVETDLGRPTRVDARARPSDDAIERLALRLLSARAPAILAGRELAERDAWAEAAELAELAGAAVFGETVPYCAPFPSEHPAYIGMLPRSQPAVREALAPFDLLVCLGADLLRMSVHSPMDPLPEGLAVVHVSERDWEIGKNHPAEIAIRADVRETLAALLPHLR